MGCRRKVIQRTTNISETRGQKVFKVLKDQEQNRIYISKRYLYLQVDLLTVGSGPGGNGTEIERLAPQWGSETRKGLLDNQGLPGNLNVTSETHTHALMPTESKSSSVHWGQGLNGHSCRKALIEMFRSS